MNNRRLKRGLRRIVSPEGILDDPASLAAYAYDSSLQTGTPEVVVFPQTPEQVAGVVKLLNEEAVPFVARGAGTNLSGGSVPLKGGAVIALSRMKKVLGIDPENSSARAEPGLTNLGFQAILGERGFFFAPDPASQKVSTLGGNFAENSGGPHCLKYGVTTNHVLGAKLVTPDGETIALGGEILDGPDSGLLGLLVGSEGTLGIATEIVCRVLPLPESVKTMLAIFDSTERAGRTVSDIIAAGIVPATLEMMDNPIIRAVEQSLGVGYPTDAAAVLIIEIDGFDEGLDETAVEIESICRGNGAREVRAARDEAERAQIWAGRRGAFGAVAALFPNYSVSDGTVPRTALPGVLRRVEEIGHAYGLEIGNVFHAGDGNLHPLIFFDSRDGEQLERVHAAGEEILVACIEAGGTITGEHGIGTEKIKSMPALFGPAEIELMRGIKNALDPRGLCNPGKILPARVEAGAKPMPAPAEEAMAEIRKFSPETPEYLAGIVRGLGSAGRSFAPVGSNTLFNRLPVRQKPDATIGMARMRKVIEHDAANLTVTVQAGLTMGELQGVLAGAGQFLPLDAPAGASVGGALACALPGPRRHIHGAARDLALGLRFIGAGGQCYRAGGKTVKNVAGYDFGKLLIGSWGTLGIITEATFRLLPLPRACGAILAAFDGVESARVAASEIFVSRLGPAVATLLNPAASERLAGDLGISVSPADYHLALGAEGSASDVGGRLGEFERICRIHGAKSFPGDFSPGDSSMMGGEAYQRMTAAIAALSHGPDLPVTDLPMTDLSVFANVRCGDTANVAARVERLASGSGGRPLVVAHLGGGAIYAHFSARPDSGETAETARRIVETVTASFSDATVTTLGGDNILTGMSFIAGKGGGAAWRKAIKKCLDPQGLLGPGMPEW